VEVEFKRTGERRYAGAGHGPKVMDPAPGFDALLPHDLLHYAVEVELGLDGAIFGQLAAGGDACTFHGVDSVPSEKVRARLTSACMRGWRVPPMRWSALAIGESLRVEWPDRHPTTRLS